MCNVELLVKEFKEDQTSNILKTLKSSKSLEEGIRDVKLIKHSLIAMNISSKGNDCREVLEKESKENVTRKILAILKDCKNLEDGIEKINKARPSLLSKEAIGDAKDSKIILEKESKENQTSSILETLKSSKDLEDGIETVEIINNILVKYGKDKDYGQSLVKEFKKSQTNRILQSLREAKSLENGIENLKALMN